MLAANEAVASHLERSEIPSIFRIHEPPDPKRVMEFEEIATHFGYSLGIGAIPVKKFSVVDRRRDGSKVRRDIVLAEPSLAVSSRHYQRLVSEDRRQARGAHPELPDAALAEAGALQRRERGALRAGGRNLHPLHLAHPALPGPDRPPRAFARPCPATARPRSRPARCAPSRRSARNRSAAPPTPSASWWSGRK